MSPPDWDDYLQFRAAFASVMDQRLYTPEWLDGEVWSGRAKFWRTADAAIVTEIRTYPTGAHDIHGIVAAGDLSEIINILIPAAEMWAKAVGCIGAIIESREGWARVLKERGYEPHRVAVRKEL